VDGLRKWELEWLRERFPLRWEEAMLRAVFPGEPISDDPGSFKVTNNNKVEFTLSFKFESKHVKFILAAGPDRVGTLSDEAGSWSLDLGDVRRVNAGDLADLIVDSYDVIVVMGS
jgi:hypothetical protein